MRKGRRARHSFLTGACSWSANQVLKKQPPSEVGRLAEPFEVAWARRPCLICAPVHGLVKVNKMV
jgi:hypothetical protein